MGVRILVGNEAGDGGGDDLLVDSRAVLFDSVTGQAFGPVFDGEKHEDAYDEAEAFLKHLEEDWGCVDPRLFLSQLMKVYGNWRQDLDDQAEELLKMAEKVADETLGEVALVGASVRVRLREYMLSYGTGVATMVTTALENPTKVAEHFLELATQCFGLRKSITDDVRVVGSREVARPSWWVEGVAESLKHSGDLVLWDAAGEKLKTEFDS